MENPQEMKTPLARIPRRRPLIGVTTSEVRRAESVQQTPEGEPPRPRDGARPHLPARRSRRPAALPMVMPPLREEAIEPLLDRLDGICLSGGPDLDPAGLRRRAAPRARADRARPRPLRAGDGASAPTRARCRSWRSAAAPRRSTSSAAAPCTSTCRRLHRDRPPAARRPGTRRATRSRSSPAAGWPRPRGDRARRQLLPPPGDRAARRGAEVGRPGAATARSRRSRTRSARS